MDRINLDPTMAIKRAKIVKKMALEDYKDIVGAAAGFVTICQMFSGVFLCKDIYKNGSTSKTPAVPFAGGLAVSVLFYQHALLMNDQTMSSVNLFGFILNMGYLIFYYLWTKPNEKNNFFKLLGVVIGLVSILLGYARIEDPQKVEFRFGIIVTAILLILIASPFADLGEVIRTKSTEKLPFPMIFSGFIVSAHWLLYGYIIKNEFVMFQNLIAVVISLIQLSLFVMFPKKIESKKKK